MARSDFYDDDPYRNKVFTDLDDGQVQNPTNLGVGTGIAGPQDGGFQSGGGAPYRPSQQEWNNASNALNAWKDKNASGQNINWESARRAFEQNAAGGQGNFGDWVNRTLDQSKSWLGGGKPAPTTPRGAFNLEGIRGRLGFGKTNMSDPQAWLQANQDVAAGATIRGDKLYDPTGRYIADVVSNFKSGGTASQFLDGIGSNGKPRVTGPKGRPGGLTTVDSGHGNDEFLPDGSRNPKYKGPRGSGGAGGSAPPAANPFLTQIRQLIMERLGKMGGDPSLDDPALKAQSEAYRVSRERGAQQQRAAMAERAAANGTLQGGQSSGSFDTTLQGIYEDVGQDIAGNDAQLLGNETMQRRAEVQNLLNMALQSGDAESARALQLQLAKMDEALRKQQLSQQNRQFNADLGYRNRALDQSGRQWDDQFGWNQNRGYEDDYRWRVLYGL